MSKQPDSLQQAVAKSLRVLSYAGLRFSTFDPDNSSQVGVYVYAVRNTGASPEAVELATKWALHDLREWPSAGLYAELCRSAEDRLTAAAVARFVPARDENGAVVLVAPERVRNGLLLPNGDTSGDGSPEPSALEAVNGSAEWRAQFWKERMEQAEREGKPERVRFAKAMMLQLAEDAERGRVPSLTKIGA